MSYIERLKFLKLPSLVYRRLRGDMIEVYKILHGIYDEDTSLSLVKSQALNTRGHSLKLKTIRSRYDIRKYSFTARIFSIWNSLTEEIVTALTNLKIDWTDTGQNRKFFMTGKPNYPEPGSEVLTWGGGH